jgi:hypothetical protein
VTAEILYNSLLQVDRIEPNSHHDWNSTAQDPARASTHMNRAIIFSDVTLERLIYLQCLVSQQ